MHSLTIKQTTGALELERSCDTRRPSIMHISNFHISRCFVYMRTWTHCSREPLKMFRVNWLSGQYFGCWYIHSRRKQNGSSPTQNAMSVLWYWETKPDTQVRYHYCWDQENKSTKRRLECYKRQTKRGAPFLVMRKLGREQQVVWRVSSSGCYAV
jgi:hypothetical protein